MHDFVEGALTFGYAVSGLFFLRFWRLTRDTLFATFCAAFWLLGLNRLLLTIVDVGSENIHYMYVVRLIAFGLIIWGIVEKNRLKSSRPRTADRGDLL